MWYNIYSSTLNGLGFKINPYGGCAAKTMIGDKQCNLVWYMEEIKLPHVYPNMVTSILNIPKGKFGDIVISIGRKNIFGHGYHNQGW